MGLKECMQAMGPLGRWMASIEGQEGYFAGRPIEEIRSRVRLDLKGEPELSVLDNWAGVDRLVRGSETGLAFRHARESFEQIPEFVLVEDTGGHADLEMLIRILDPFVAAPGEMCSVFQSDASHYFEAVSEKDKIFAAEYINVLRRALVDLGLPLLPSEAMSMIERIRNSLDDFQEARNFLSLLKNTGEEDERRRELLDQVASLESALASGLIDVFRLNALSPEVDWRFSRLWEAVRLSRMEGRLQSALIQASVVMDDAFRLAGLDYEDLVDRVDLISDTFSEPDALKTAIMVAEEAERGEPPADMEEDFLGVMENSLREIGLQLPE